MSEASIQDQESLFLSRIDSAATLDELESARVEALGRKGSLNAGLQRDGQARRRKQKAASASCSTAPSRSSKARTRASARRSARQRSTRASMPNGWISRCPRPALARPSASRHADPARDRRPVRVAGLRRARWPRSRNRIPQLRRAQHSGRPSRARHAGYLLARWRQPAAHPHLARAGARHGATRPAAAHDRARPRLPQRRAWMPRTSTPSISSKA